MTHDDDVVVGVEFLVSARRNIAHRDMFCACDARGFVFPCLANIEQRKCFAALLQRLDLPGRDFEVHKCLSVEGAGPISLRGRDAASRVSTKNQTIFPEPSAGKSVPSPDDS